MRKVLVIALALGFVLASFDADAQRRKRKRKKDRKKDRVEKVQAADEQKAKGSDNEGGRAGDKKVQVLDFTGLSLEGRMRTPQLMYFLGRAREELQRASLEKRSFLPELARTVDEGGL